MGPRFSEYAKEDPRPSELVHQEDLIPPDTNPFNLHWPMTPSTIEAPSKQRVPGITQRWSQRYTGKWPNPELLPTVHINAAVETEGIRLWMPIPRDPLSDYVGLPLVSIPQQIIHDLSMEATANVQPSEHDNYFPEDSIICPNSMPILPSDEEKFEDSWKSVK